MGPGGAQPLVFASIRTTAWGPRRQGGSDGCGDVGRLAKDGQVTEGEKGKDSSSPDAVRQCWLTTSSPLQQHRGLMHLDVYTVPSTHFKV